MHFDSKGHNQRRQIDSEFKCILFHYFREEHIMRNDHLKCVNKF